MHALYNCSSIKVNNPSSLIENNYSYKVERMKYGERLKQARELAGLTQAELANGIKNVCTQENISKLERGEATGSEFTAQFAHACGVSPLWLASESGAMVGAFYVVDEKQKRAIQLMQDLPPYAIDHVIQEITDTAELIRKAGTDKKPPKENVQ